MGERLLIHATESDITLYYACEACERKPFEAAKWDLCCCHPNNARIVYLVLSGVWLSMLIICGGALVIYGLAGDHCCDFRKLLICIGLILLMCAILFASFFLFDSKSFRKYTMHILVPWFVCSMLIFVGIIIAFVIKLINVKLFLITSLPVFSLTIFVFGEIFHYIGRMRIRPLHMQFKEITKGAENKLQNNIPSSSQASWTSRVVSLHSNTIMKDGIPDSDASQNNHYPEFYNETQEQSSFTQNTQAADQPRNVMFNKSMMQQQQHHPNEDAKLFLLEGQVINSTVKSDIQQSTEIDIHKTIKEQTMNKINQNKLIPQSLTSIYKTRFIVDKENLPLLSPSKRTSSTFLENLNLAEVRWMSPENARTE